MTPELLVLALAALLQAFQIGLAAMVMNRDVGAKWNAGPRDSQPEFSPSPPACAARSTTISRG